MTAPEVVPSSGLNAASAARLLRALMNVDEPAPLEASGEALPRIAGYRLLERVSSGGGGSVYRAVRDGAETVVAIKLLRAPLGSGPDAQRVWRELHVIEQLRSIHVPRLLDYGVHEGHLFLVTEFVEGQSPGRSESGPLASRRESVQLLAAIADAVQDLHERGLIHRDLKPDNMLVTPAGDIVILDLGLALLQSSGEPHSLTIEGTPHGTPAFMSPEQARGDLTRITTRTDVYSIGAIGYLLLTGETPHAGGRSVLELVRRVAQEPARSPSDIDGSIPKDLAAVLQKACAREPGERYPSAAAFAADLRRWLKGEPIEARSPGLWRRATMWVAHHPIAATAACCAIMIGTTIAGMAAGTWWFKRSNFLPDRAVVSSHEPWEVRILAPSGRLVASWPSSRAANDSFGTALAVKVRRPAPFNDTVFVTYADSERQSPWDKTLCVWRPDDFENPLWSSPGEDHPALTPPYPEADGLSRRLKPKSPGQYVAYRAEMADVFPERPGEEIIVVLTSDEHPTAVRVYDLAGEVLFEFWHMGTVGDVHWVPEPGLIVANACHGRRAWADQGFTGDNARSWPSVVFAVHPVIGPTEGWVCDGDLFDKSIDLRWYRFIVHGSESGTRQIIGLGVGAARCIPAQRAELRGRSFDLQLTALGMGICGRVTVDNEARIVDRVLSDTANGSAMVDLFEGIELSERMPAAPSGQ